VLACGPCTGILRGMRSAVHRLLLCALTAVLLSGCGVGAQDRPILVGSEPASGSTVVGPVRVIRVDYDDPVDILNPFDARVYAGGVLQSSAVFVLPTFPNSIFIEPGAGATWPVDVRISVQLIQGIVVNEQLHYSAVVYGVGFDVGPEAPIAVTRPGMVTLLDTTTWTAASSTPTPAGRDPVGAMRTAYDSVPRVWAQLDNGSGGGDALAYFAPGDAGMTVVALTTSGGDLTCAAPSLLVGPLGRFVYAAYRDETSGRIRLARVDIETGLETGSLELESVPADPATTPAGVTLEDPGGFILISAHDGATGTLAVVDPLTFAEVDRDDMTPGIQGTTLDMGAGPVAFGGSRAGIAIAGGSDLTLVRRTDGDVSTSTSMVVGTSVDVLRSRDANLMIQPLAGFDADLALQRRTAATGYSDPVGVAVSDDIAGISTGATDAVAMQHRGGSKRFLLLLDTPGGLIATSWQQSGTTLTQEDLDDLTDGIQAVDVQSEIPGATSIGFTYGSTPAR